MYPIQEVGDELFRHFIDINDRFLSAVVVYEAVPIVSEHLIMANQLTGGEMLSEDVIILVFLHDSQFFHPRQQKVL